jgi:hypothetical protein
MTSRLLARLGAATGLAYVVLIVVGNSVVTPGGEGPAFTEPASEVGAYLVAHPPTTATYVGAFIELLGLLCFVAFVAKLFCVLRRAEGGDGFLSVTALGAGLLSAAVKIGSGPAALEAFNRAREGIDPQLAAALLDMNGFAFMLTFALDALMLAAAAPVVLHTRVLPRWLGVGAAVTAVLLLATVAGAGSVPPVGMLLLLLWVAAVSVALVRRAAAPEPARATAQPSASVA